MRHANSPPSHRGTSSANGTFLGNNQQEDDGSGAPAPSAVVIVLALVLPLCLMPTAAMLAPRCWRGDAGVAMLTLKISVKNMRARARAWRARSLTLPLSPTGCDDFLAPVGRGPKTRKWLQSLAPRSPRPSASEAQNNNNKKQEKKRPGRAQILGIVASRMTAAVRRGGSR